MITPTNQSTLKPLYDAVCLLASDLDELEVTAGNKELVRNALIERISALPLVAPYQIKDLQPDADATVKTEIEQIKDRLQHFKQQLENDSQI
ncbi:MAG: hypothetical protein OQK12_00930 [Motiliproteus sp.]|nr:hypothetical protein [Motiliproteus sp.]